MKIAFFADSHLGYQAYNKTDENGINIREKDGYIAYRAVIEDIIKNKCDIVIIGGDLFHEPKPSPLAIREAIDGITALTNANIKVYITKGNHDCTDKNNDVSAVDMVRSLAYVGDQDYEVVDLGEGIVLHLVHHNHYYKQSETMDKLAPIADKCNILVAHGGIYGKDDIIFRANKAPREVVLPREVLTMGFDLILLGHIHERQKIRENIYYAGSLVRRGFSDGKGDIGRGWILFDTSKKDFAKNGEFKYIKERYQQEVVIDTREENWYYNLTEKLDKTIEGANGELGIYRVILTHCNKAYSYYKEIKEIKGKYANKVLELGIILEKEETEKKKAAPSIKKNISSGGIVQGFEKFFKETYKDTEDVSKQAFGLGVELLRQKQEKQITEAE